MSKKFNIREWVLSVKYWSLLFIPHIAICLIFFIYALVGASIIQEIESDDTRITSSPIEETSSIIQSNVKNFDRDRERFLSKIIDKKQIVDVQQYTKYITKYIRDYEEELKKSFKSVATLSNSNLEKTSKTEEKQLRWTFSGSLYFIGTSLTTIGSNEFTPVTKSGKFFLMIYAAIGIPLTLVFLSDLSLLITRLIKYLTLILLRIYSSKYFFHIRQWNIFRFIEKQLNISIPHLTDDEDHSNFNSAMTSTAAPVKNSNEFLVNDRPIQKQTINANLLFTQQLISHLRNIYNLLVDTINDVNDNVDLTMTQMSITLLIYILIGAFLVSSGSYFDGIYLCFTSLFSINLRDFYRQATVTNIDHSGRLLFIFAIYLLFGLAIASICIKTVQFCIQQSLENLGKKILVDLVEFLRQMGFHELSTDDILSSNDVNQTAATTSPIESNSARNQRLLRIASTTSFDQTPSTPPVLNWNVRPIGVAEPLRRLSGTVIVRSMKNASGETDSSRDKTVQVNTIIRSCGRCAGTNITSTPSALTLKKHRVVSSSPSSAGDLSSGCEEEDNMLALPNLDRVRQRRATLVAKTIIHHMATQPSNSKTDDLMPSMVHLTASRSRPSESPPASIKYSVNTKSLPPESPKNSGTSQQEFIEISKQISSLLTPSDDES